MNKKTKTILLINGVLIIILLIIGFYLWFAQSQLFVKAGLAEKNFPYKMYTTFELQGMYSQEPLENVTTTQTPEQTHALFISALRKGDIDGAVECCVVKSNQEKMREKLNRIKDADNFMLMVKDISTADFFYNKDLEKESRINIEFYGIEKDKKIGALMTFQKNLDGVWLIESF